MGGTCCTSDTALPADVRRRNTVESTQPLIDNTLQSETAHQRPTRQKIREAIDKTIDTACDAKDKFDERLSMQGLLHQARLSLEHYIDPKLIAIEERISRRILSNALGIAFISEAKGGFIFGVKG